MNTATIVAQYVDRPKPGKTNWSVKDSNGNYFSMSPKIITDAGIAPGGQYIVNYDVKNFAGRTFNMVSSAMPAQQQPMPPIPQQHIPALTPTQQAYAPPAPQPPPLMAPKRPYMGPTTGYSGPNKDEQIFVTACLARFIQAGLVEPSVSSVATTVNTLREAWAQTFGNKQVDPELNDAIPFDGTP